MNIYDIAKKAGVSTATVSRYINKSGYVGKKTSAILQAVIEKSGYQISALAQNLSTGNTLKLIGLVCYDINDLYYAKCASILEKRLKSAGYEIILVCTGKNAKDKQESVDSLLQKNVDALIFIGAVFMDISEKIVKDAAKICPCFIINSLLSGDNIYCAYCDDFAAVADTVNRLKSEGRSKPVYLHNNDTYGTKLKIQGFLNAYPHTDSIFMLDEDFDESVIVIAQILRENRPDAVVCASDIIAVAVIKAASNLALDIPKDVAVVGHNNSLFTKVTSPTISSIDNGVEILSELTAANIIRLFSGETLVKDTKIDYTLKRRESF